MKLILILVCLSNVSISQTFYDVERICDKYWQVQFSRTQQELLLAKFKTIHPDSVHYTKETGKFNQYVYSVLNEEQKRSFDSLCKYNFVMVNAGLYAHLQLTTDQTNKMFDILRSMDKTDSIQANGCFTIFPKDSLLTILDATQLAAEFQKNAEEKKRYHRQVAHSDSLRYNEMIFYREKLQLVKRFHTKHLSNAKERLLKNIKSIHPEDITNASQLMLTYQDQVDQTLRSESHRFQYDSDSVLLEPNRKAILEYRHEAFKYFPDLCIYWCRFGAQRTPEFIEEENRLTAQLAYFKTTYAKYIVQEEHHLKKHIIKFQGQIEEIKPPKKPGVTILPDVKIPDLETTALLLLALD